MHETTLSIVIATRDDPLIWATVNSLFAHHALPSGTELLIVDNSPEGSRYAADLRKHVSANKSVRYLRYIGPESSCLYKDAGFRQAAGEWVLCCDSHVLFPPGAIDALLRHFDAHPESGDLIMGPCLNSALHVQGTNQMLYSSEPYDLPALSTVHHGVVCRGDSLGVWVRDDRGLDPSHPAFEVMQQGTGAFAMRRKAWPGFHPAMTSFGGNETYLMESVRAAGGRVLCLPAFRWIHSFYAPAGKPYPAKLELRIRNYLVGFLALGRLDLFNAAQDYFHTQHPRETAAAEKRAEKEVAAVNDLIPFHGEEKTQPPRNGTPQADHKTFEDRLAALESAVFSGATATTAQEKAGVYEKYILLWQKAGGDIGGSIPKPLFTTLCHIKNEKLDDAGKRPTRTLEFGIGLSTLAFDRQGTEHTAIEHNAAWIDRVRPQLKGDTVSIVHSPLKGNWYDWQPEYGTLYDLILIDGPPGNSATDPGRRGAIEAVPHLLAPGGTIIIDDTHREAEQEVSAALAERLGLVARRNRHGHRAYDVLTAKLEPLPSGQPGTELHEWLKNLPNMPECQLCYWLAVRMNKWGVEGCKQHVDLIVEDMLPRARAWWANSEPWMKAEAWFVGQGSIWTALKATVHPDGALRDSIRQHVLSAISRSEAFNRQ